MNNSKYYLQDKSYYHGNHMNWWAKDSKGYTANLDNAHQFTADEIAKMQSRGMRDTDVAWLCSYIDDRSERCVNASFCNYEEMKKQENILLSHSDNNGWIRVEDGLPDDDKDDYLVYSIHTKVYEKVDIEKLKMMIDNSAKITHWQPLPQPPKE